MTVKSNDGDIVATSPHHVTGGGEVAVKLSAEDVDGYSNEGKYILRYYKHLDEQLFPRIIHEHQQQLLQPQAGIQNPGACQARVGGRVHLGSRRGGAWGTPWGRWWCTGLVGRGG